MNDAKWRSRFCTRLFVAQAWTCSEMQKPSGKGVVADLRVRFGAAGAGACAALPCNPESGFNEEGFRKGESAGAVPFLSGLFWIPLEPAPILDAWSKSGISLPDSRSFLCGFWCCSNLMILM